MKDIITAIQKLEQHEHIVKDNIFNKIIESAQNVCKKYHKVIEGFELGNGTCYFIFMGEPQFDGYVVKGANDITDETDWDLIELYGIDNDDDFKNLYNLLSYYDERFSFTDINLELLKSNDYKIEYHS